MMHDPAPAALLPHAAPAQSVARLTLFAMRRMAAFGLQDAHAANAMLGHFGLGYRRPLVLLRAFMHELADGATRAIMVAPCCCARMTTDEARMMRVLAEAGTDSRSAARVLAQLSGRAVNNPALSAAMAFHDALADMGRPLQPC